MKKYKFGTKNLKILQVLYKKKEIKKKKRSFSEIQIQIQIQLYLTTEGPLQLTVVLPWGRGYNKII